MAPLLSHSPPGRRLQKETTLYQAQAQCEVHSEPGFSPAFLSRIVVGGAHSSRLSAFLYDNNSPQTHYNQSLRTSWSMVRFIEYRQENQYQLGLPWSCINMESKPCGPWASCSQPDTQTLLDAVLQGQLEDPHFPDLPVFVAPKIYFSYLKCCLLLLPLDVPGNAEPDLESLRGRRMRNLIFMCNPLSLCSWLSSLSPQSSLGCSHPLSLREEGLSWEDSSGPKCSPPRQEDRSSNLQD